MHRMFCSLGCLLCFMSCVMCSCATDTHYDSLAVKLTIPDMFDVSYAQTSKHLTYKITFDRDVASLQSFTLDDAWLSMDVGDSDEDRMAMIKAVSISLSKEDSSNDAWLTSIENLRRKNELEFLEVNDLELSQYLENSQIPIVMDIEFDPYFVHSYQQTYCQNKDICPLDLHLSMTFKMVDE